MSQQELDKVKQLWADNAHWRTSQIVHWTQHPRVRERLNHLASGDPRKDRFEYFLEHYLPGRLPVKRALTLGCGHGELGRGLAKYNFAVAQEGVDISDGAVADATRLAHEAGLKNLKYRVEDLNSIQLPRYTYDVIFGVMSIHHVNAIEHLFKQVAESLKPNGFFFLDEFIGPSQFQWRDEQLAVLNEQIALLPERYRPAVSNPIYQKELVRRFSVEEMNAVDPSEAIRSSEIVELLSEYFDILEVRGCGGSLLHLLLEEIAGNFPEDDADANRYLESLFELEDQLIASGKLEHDFAIIIAKKRTSFRTWIDYGKHKLRRAIGSR